jgi:hypothetical protein
MKAKVLSGFSRRLEQKGIQELVASAQMRDSDADALLREYFQPIIDDVVDLYTQNTYLANKLTQKALSILTSSIDSYRYCDRHVSFAHYTIRRIVRFLEGYVIMEDNECACGYEYDIHTTYSIAPRRYASISNAVFSSSIQEAVI